MRIVKSCNKPVSVFVGIAFLAMLCFWANQTPAAPSAPAAGPDSAAAAASGENESTGFVEIEEEPPAVKKGGKFPWLLVIAGAVVVGAAVYYFAVANKKYTLTVDMGEGVSGNPASGATKYKKGSTVGYNYALASGYTNLEVTLDGAAVDPSSTVKMDGNHTLRARAARAYTLTVNRGTGVSGTPASGSYIYGSGTAVSYSYTATGELAVRLDGVAVPASGTVTMDANHTLDASVQYTLKVTLGAGTTGTPAATASYEKGEAVSYSYSTLAGYSNLQVRLDGTLVAASGTVTMNGSHAIVTSAAKGATVNLTSTPSGARVYDNGADTGRDTNTSITYTNAGTHAYVLRNCGFQDFSKTQSVAIGGTYDIHTAMLPGILDEFLVSPTCWQPYSKGNWKVVDGTYQARALATYYNFSQHTYKAPSANFTVSVKLKLIAGDVSNAITLFLSTSADPATFTGYSFQITYNGSYSVYRRVNYHLLTGDGDVATFKGWTPCQAIQEQKGAWNTVKVVRNGGNYSLYINDRSVWSFTHDGLDPRYISLGIYCGRQTHEVHYDYVKLEPGATAGSVAGAAVRIGAERPSDYDTQGH